jgi:hypothetical protein
MESAVKESYEKCSSGMLEAVALLCLKILEQ